MEKNQILKTLSRNATGREMSKAGKSRQENMFAHDEIINFHSTPPFSRPKTGEKKKTGKPSVSIRRMTMAAAGPSDLTGNFSHFLCSFSHDVSKFACARDHFRLGMPP